MVVQLSYLELRLFAAGRLELHFSLRGDFGAIFSTAFSAWPRAGAGVLERHCVEGEFFGANSTFGLVRFGSDLGGLSGVFLESC